MRMGNDNVWTNAAAANNESSDVVDCRHVANISFLLNLSGAGSATFRLQASNDGTNYYNYSSVNYAGVAGLFLLEKADFNFAYARLLVDTVVGAVVVASTYVCTKGA